MSEGIEMTAHTPNSNRLEEHIANLLISVNLADKKHSNSGHHITHVYGYEPIFKCGICHEMKQRGILARTRHNRKISHWSYFICHECLERAKQGREQQ